MSAGQTPYECIFYSLYIYLYVTDFDVFVSLSRIFMKNIGVSRIQS